MGIITERQLSLQDTSDEYKQFLEKFRPKKTTDDCYTPDNIYEAVAGWVAEEYNLDRNKFVRPFYPGGDYDAGITYENGATVATSFCTNLDRWHVRSAPELQRRINEANRENLTRSKKRMPKYEYPPDVLTSTDVGYLSKYGVDFRLRREDGVFIRRMDAQISAGKVIFGGYFADQAGRRREGRRREGRRREGRRREGRRQMLAAVRQGEVAPG